MNLVKILLVDHYFLLRKKFLVTDDLYRRNGIYEFIGGVNWMAVLALGIGCGVAFVGLIYSPLRVLYNYAWFVGFGVSFGSYLLLMGMRRPSSKAAV